MDIKIIKGQAMIIRNETDKDRAIRHIKALNMDKPWQMECKPYKKNRSIAQNKLMWKWFKEIGDELGHDNTDVVYADMVEMFLLLIDYTGLDGKPKQRRQGTSKLTTKEFTEFLEKVDRFSVSFLGIILTSPEDLYYEAMGIKRT